MPKANRNRANEDAAGKKSEPVHPGERTSPEGKAVVNSLLLAIPDDEFHLIRPHLQFVCLAQRSRLHEANTKLEDAYFLNTGMVSLVFTTRDGESVEVGVLGNEGFTPIPISVGFRRSPHHAVMQIGGEGFKVSVDVLETVLASSPKLQALLHRYAAIHGLQVAQTAGCNRLHDLEQRLCRWLLLTQDRVGSGLLQHYARFSGDDAGDGSSEREPGGGRAAEETDHRICAWIGKRF